MASLIVHGDLGTVPAALPRPVYVRPIFVPMARFRQPPERSHSETTNYWSI